MDHDHMDLYVGWAGRGKAVIATIFLFFVEIYFGCHRLSENFDIMEMFWWLFGFPSVSYTSDSVLFLYRLQCLYSKWHLFPLMVHYLVLGPIGLVRVWAHRALAKRGTENRVPFGTSNWINSDDGYCHLKFVLNISRRSQPNVSISSCLWKTGSDKFLGIRYMFQCFSRCSRRQCHIVYYSWHKVLCHFLENILSTRISEGQ